MLFSLCRVARLLELLVYAFEYCDAFVGLFELLQWTLVYPYLPQAPQSALPYLINLLLQLAHRHLASSLAQGLVCRSALRVGIVCLNWLGRREWEISDRDRERYGGESDGMQLNLVYSMLMGADHGGRRGCEAQGEVQVPSFRIASS